MPQRDAGPAIALVGPTDRSLAAVCPAGARVMVVAAEALVTTSAADAAELALHAVEMLRPGQPSWVELGGRIWTLEFHRSIRA